jgi:hypothetical protein
MFSTLLALALVSQFSQEQPVEGDDMIVVGKGEWMAKPVKGASNPRLAGTTYDVQVPPGQLGKVIRKFDDSSGSPFAEVWYVLRLPNSKSITVEGQHGNSAIKVKDLALAKKIAAELREAAAKAAEKHGGLTSVQKNAAVRKAVAKVYAKDKHVIMKKYKLDAATMTLLELAAKANGW